MWLLYTLVAAVHTTESYICTHCELKLFQHSDLGETCAPNVQSFKCTVEGCGRCYSRADTLSAHMKTAHGESVVQKKSRFICPVAQCSKTCFHATQLINHLSEHKINVGR